VPSSPFIPQSPCPVCGQKEAIVASRRDRRGEPLLTVCCPHCGLFRNDPLPTSDELRRFHAAEYRESYKGVRTPKARNVYRSARLARHRLEQLGRRLPARARILDVGSGSGEWLAALAAAGHQVSGVEPDPHYGEYARQQYGVSVETAGILDLERPEGSLDVITLFHVLEHLPDPLAVLAKFRGWLRPGGLLIVEVPNTNCVHQNPAGRFHAAHVIGFTRESLDHALRAGGWERMELSLGSQERNLLAIACKPAAPPSPGAVPPPPGAVPPPPLLTSPATLWQYYLRPATYLRFLARMAQFAAEWLAVRRGVTPRAVLGLAQNSNRKTS
jgi:2-polyprenyl-3-methyl-5-hydroxy-6-metoxy-1,4-benzoquinol methylase